MTAYRKIVDLSDFISQMINYMCYTLKSTEHGALGVEHADMIWGCVTIKALNMGEMEVHRKRGLAPCPICDGDAVFVEYGGGYFIKCSWCECMIARQISVTTETILPFETEEQAAKVWNRRKGVEVAPKPMSGMTSMEDVLKARNERCIKIVNAIGKQRGERITVGEIAADIGLTKPIVTNMMPYVKSKYPQVKADNMGYYWEEN